jgi:hypothetical protein
MSSFGGASDWVLELRGLNSTYTFPALGYQGNMFFVQTPAPGNVSSYDVNRTLSAQVYSPSLRVRSAVLLSAVTLTGQAFVLSSVSGCVGQSGSGTYGCMAGQRVEVTGSGFSLTAQLQIGSQRGNDCRFVNTTRMSCWLPYPLPRQDAAFVSVQLLSGRALSSLVQAGVQFTPTPLVRRVTGCSSVQQNITAGCNSGQAITVEGSV